MGFTEMIRDAGIVGCGGAGFPTHVKYAAEGIRHILINGAECEPLLKTDHYLMREKADALIEAADYLLKESGAEQCTIALKKTYLPEIASLEKAIGGRSSRVGLKLMDSFFPAGDELTVIREVTGRTVAPGKLPISAGCVVSNVATLYCIYQAMQGHPFIYKYLTVTGEVREPKVLKVPLGTPLMDCVAMCGGSRIGDFSVINGGPMMGKILSAEEAENAFVTKTTSGLIVVPQDSAAVVRSHTDVRHMLNRARSACIQCSFCTQLCPRHLLGHPLEPHRIMRMLSGGGDVDGMLTDPVIRTAALCCECGICEVYACPMGLQPRRINSILKKKLAAAGIRTEYPDGEYEAKPEREIRKAPTSRVAERSGVGRYKDISVTEFHDAAKAGEVDRVCLSLRQGIGGPSVPVVKDGDAVLPGDLIAALPEKGIGSALHAPIAGTVRVTDGFIEIRGIRASLGGDGR